MFLAIRQVKAQEIFINRYRDELIALKVPVNNIEISDAVRGVALVVLQSQSENNRLILEDYRNSILGLRAGAVAARDSKAVRSVKVQIVNKSGAVIDETQLFFYPEDETKFSQQTARALTNAQVEDVVHKLLDTHGLEMESLRILDHSGAILNGRELDIVLVSRDPQSVNYDVNVAYTSWLNLMDNANLQYSADLILSSLQIKDEKGEILVDAIKDIENKALHVALLKEKVDLGINGPLPPPGEGKPGSVDSGVSAGYPVSPTNANPAP